MPIVNDLNNYAKEELEYFGVRRQNEELKYVNEVSNDEDEEDE